MKKILILFLVILSFGITNADYNLDKKIAIEAQTKFDYEKYYETSKQLRNLVNKYYYSIVFEKGDENKIYGNIENKLAEYNKYSKMDRYSEEATINEFLDYPNNQEIVNTLGYHTFYYNRYEYINNNGLFIKEYNFENIKKLNINEKIDGIYLGLKFSKVKKEDRYEKIRNKYLKSIYTKYNNKKSISFKKIDLEKFDGKIKININKFTKEINEDEIYIISLNFYLKKGENYIALYKNKINSNFIFDKYSILDALERKYIEETNPNRNYYRDSSINTKLDDVLNEKLKIIFEKIKSKKTNTEYLSFLETVKSKIIKFSKDREKYTKLVEEVKDEVSFQKAYSKYKKYKKQEKIVNILLVFISNEIYENTLEDTIKDFIN